MFKQTIIYLIISAFVIFFAKYAHLLIINVDLIYTYLNLKLAFIFNTNPTGIFIRKIVTLIVIPVLLVSIPGLIYWIVRKKRMPYFFEMIWVIWMIIVLSNILIH